MISDHDTRTAPDRDIHAPESVLFDERAFVRSARAKAVRRSVLISAVVVLCGVMALAGSWVAWERAIQTQTARIDAYLTELVPLSEPNTFVADARTSDRQFPGAVRTYRAYRPVGARPLPKGKVSAEFDVWGGEVVASSGTLAWADPARGFSATGLAPDLRFLHPAAASGQARQPEPEDRDDIDGMTASTRDAALRLGSAPDSSTVELAISFRGLKTIKELQALLGDGVTLNWAAVSVWEKADSAFVPREGNMVGISFVGPDGSAAAVPSAQLEKNLPSRLRSVSRHAPRGSAELCVRSADYLERSGVRYYGAVVTGRARDMRAILRHDAVTAAVLGFVVEPWE